jgi:amino acid transporter
LRSSSAPGNEQWEEFVNREPADNPSDAAIIADDMRTLHRLGYAQELARRMSGFSNLALSLSIICILAGGVTSFHLGFCSVGGAAIGLGWPLACCLSLIVAATMAQLASAFPTAGGLYHWAAILGGRGWGWTTAWFNLAGLVTVLAAINVGTFQFVARSFTPHVANEIWVQTIAVALMTASQAVLNHLGGRVTTRLIDFSGYWILAVSAVLTLALFAAAAQWDVSRLVTTTNFGGLPPEAPVWPTTNSAFWLFGLGLLLPAYTITGFDASAHAAEETIGAAREVPRGIIRSVLISGIAGWLMLMAVVLAMPSQELAAHQGANVFVWTLNSVLPGWLVGPLCGGIAVAQYLCGLATVTSASRMAYAFARDGGLPASALIKIVSPRFRTPTIAIWTVAAAATLFTIYTPIYSTITAVCTIFLYVSYVLPTALGLLAYGQSWSQMGPWHLGRWYRPLAAVSVLACGGLLLLGIQPPNERAAVVLGGALAALAALWWCRARHSFPGPPQGVALLRRQAEIRAAEDRVHQAHDDLSAAEQSAAAISAKGEGAHV